MKICKENVNRIISETEDAGEKTFNKIVRIFQDVENFMKIQMSSGNGLFYALYELFYYLSPTKVYSYNKKSSYVTSLILNSV